MNHIKHNDKNIMADKNFGKQIGKTVKNPFVVKHGSEKDISTYNISQLQQDVRKIKSDIKNIIKDVEYLKKLSNRLYKRKSKVIYSNDETNPE